MDISGARMWRNGLFFTWALLCSLVSSSAGLLTTKGVNYEVQALMGIKASLTDPHGAMENWVQYSVDPCSWATVTCSPELLVVSLEIPNANLSGSLSPTIGNLTNLETLSLKNNNISGQIPQEIGKLRKLKTLDLSNNHLTGEIPFSLGQLESLQYLRLNNNSLSGAFPFSSSNFPQLFFLDLSYNNLSGSIPESLAKMFNFVGNPLICAAASEQDCHGRVVAEPMPMSYNVNMSLSNDFAEGLLISLRPFLS